VASAFAHASENIVGMTYDNRNLTFNSRLKHWFDAKELQYVFHIVLKVVFVEDKDTLYTIE
jgi:hypothetical protein